MQGQDGTSHQCHNIVSSLSAGMHVAVSWLLASLGICAWSWRLPMHEPRGQDGRGAVASCMVSDCLVGPVQWARSGDPRTRLRWASSAPSLAEARRLWRPSPLQPPPPAPGRPSARPAPHRQSSLQLGSAMSAASQLSTELLSACMWCSSSMHAVRSLPLRLQPQQAL